MIVDTGVLVAAADLADPDHRACADLLDDNLDGLTASPLVVAETGYLIGRQLGSRSEAQFFDAVADGEIHVETLTANDWHRTAELVGAYADMPLGGTDASVVAIAERLGETSIATLDHRHFGVVRPSHVSAFRLLP
ncbi:MAG: PIN domain-containing protein [Acidimicrobiaceae bacterium]|nr:PIN domain-containing protein [Acidimicrobiaceae bacterium]MXX41598.1 PIN domain-containing protein [Acidimicrobiales bacterium]MDE0321609.1 PIN domain-containing protein [Acidimicrobiaceae bacterium]MDE0676284.1 PIN domain-containing protein [Acidimicrobiaceae bacterium]MYD34077.1 PIN domain-containing protein [Acidimicrobiales bacterium]